MICVNLGSNVELVLCAQFSRLGLLKAVWLGKIELIEFVGAMRLVRFVEIFQQRVLLWRAVNRDASLLSVKVRSIGWVFENWLVRCRSLAEHQLIPFYSMVKIVLHDFLWGVQTFLRILNQKTRN